MKEINLLKNLFPKCPKCKIELALLSDIEGYDFLCLNCDKRFYSSEVDYSSVEDY